MRKKLLLRTLIISALAGMSLVGCESEQKSEAAGEKESKTKEAVLKEEKTEQKTEQKTEEVTEKKEIDKSDGDAYYSIPSDYKIKDNDVTYGEIKTLSYHSTTVGKDRKVTVVLPPNYTTEKQYPVVYLCHGLGQDNSQWVAEGSAHIIIGNLIAKGEAEEMILVMPNCRARMNDAGNPPDAFSLDNYKAFDNFYNEFITDLKPFIESEFSVKTGRENTAIAGFSMGGRVALHLGLGMQDVFGYVGAFCPAPGIFGYTLNGVTEPGLFQKENFKIADEYKGNTHIMIVAGKADRVVFDHPESYHTQLDANNSEHIWYKLAGGHDFVVTGKGFYNFAKELFK